jgi:hypothetical protein
MKRQIIWAIAMLSLLTSACQDSPEPSKTSPPMGWNSWDCFGMDVTEDQFKQTADYMAKHLVSTGWDYVVIDMGWDYDEGLNTSNFRMQNPPLCFDEFGRLIPNLRRFPSSARDSGFRELGDYVHNLGLKFGIHIQRGIPWEAVEKNTPVKGTSYRAKDIYTDSMACTWYHGMKTAKYVSMFNISDNDKRKIKVTWEELGIVGKFTVRDLWQKKDIGKFTDSFEMTINPHGCGFYKVSKSLL